MTTLADPPRTPRPEADPLAPRVVATTPDVTDVPRDISTRTLDDSLSVVSTAVGSFALVGLVFASILPFSGALGFAFCWAVTFLVMYGAVSSLNNPRPIVIDRLVGAAVAIGALVCAIALASTLIYTFVKGIGAATNINFYTQDMGGVRPTAPLDQGGILHAIVGSAIQVAIAVAFSLPLGILTGVYLTEVGGRFAFYVRTVVEAMTALPDILAGLFIYVTLIVALGWDRSGFAAACALAITMIPIIARTTEVQLRIVPDGLREAGLALGSSKWGTVRRVVLPTAKAGLATALILAIARGVGETAPVLITSGASTFTNGNPFSEPMNSLPLFIFTSVRSGQELAIERAFGAGLVLLVIVLILFVVMRLLTRQKGSR